MVRRCDQALRRESFGFQQQGGFVALESAQRFGGAGDAFGAFHALLRAALVVVDVESNSMSSEPTSWERGLRTPPPCIGAAMSAHERRGRELAGWLTVARGGAGGREAAAHAVHAFVCRKAPAAHVDAGAARTSIQDGHALEVLSARLDFQSTMSCRLSRRSSSGARVSGREAPPQGIIPLGGSYDLIKADSARSSGSSAAM